MAQWGGRLLGLTLMVALVPGWYQAASAPRWIVATVGLTVMLWLLNNQGEWRLGWGSVFLALAALSLLWSPQPLDGVGSLWKWSLLAAAFVVGQCGGAGPIYEGAAIGLAANSAVCIAQVLGFEPVRSANAVAGLFGNKDFLAEAALPIAVWAVWQRRWVLPLIAPALLLPQARMVMLIGVPLLLWPFSRVAAVSIAVMGAAVLIVSVTVVWPSDVSKGERWAVWRDTALGITVLGRGIGQFYGTYPDRAVYEDVAARRPLHAHSDALEIFYELGPLGLAAAFGFLLSVFWGGAGVWLFVFLAVVLDGLVAFPFHNPASGVLALLAAGALQRGRGLIRAGEPAGAVYAV